MAVEKQWSLQLRRSADISRSVVDYENEGTQLIGNNIDEDEAEIHRYLRQNGEL